MLTYTIIRFDSQANAGTVDVLQGAPFCVTYASALHRSSELALYRVVSEWRILARSGRRRRKRRRRPSLARIRNDSGSVKDTAGSDHIGIEIIETIPISQSRHESDHTLARRLRAPWLGSQVI